MTQEIMILENKVNNFSTWAESSLIYNLNSSTRFSSLYTDYRGYAINQGTIPLTRNMFSRELKSVLKPSIELNKVNWVNRSGIKIMGIDYKGNTSTLELTQKKVDEQKSETNGQKLPNI